MKNFIRVAIYIRVSTDRQANFEGKRIEDGSPEVQKTRAIEYIQKICDQLGKQFQIKFIIEDTKSAKDTNRKGFQQLLRVVEDRQVDWIVTSELSRLNREFDDFVFFRKLCKDNDVEMLFTGGIYGKKDASTEMLENIMASYADFERKLTSMRLKRNINSRLLTDGKINGAEELLGLDRDAKRTGHFIINKSEVETLIKLLNIFLSSTGHVEALRTAKKMGIKDKNNLDIALLRFKNILRNVEWRYSGKWYLIDEDDNEKKIINLPHGSLLSEELVNQVVTKRDELAKKNVRCGTNNFVYLLSALIKGPSNEKFSGQIGHGRNSDYRYYYSKSLNQRLNATEIESLVEKRVIKYFRDSKTFQRIVNSGFGSRDSRVSELKKEVFKTRLELKDLELTIDTLVTRMTVSSLSDSAIETIAKKLTDLETTKSTLASVITAKELLITEYLSTHQLTDAKDKIAKYAQEFKNLNRVQRRDLLETIFEKIEVMDAYNLRLHLKRPPNWGDSELVLKNGCARGISGGTNRT